MPFITEEIWQRLPKGREAPASIMIARFPRRRAGDAAAEADFGPIIDVVTKIRNVRSEMQIPPARSLTAIVKPADARLLALLQRELTPLGAVARAEVRVDRDAVRPPQSALAVSDAGEVYVPLEGVIDVGAERRRLERELGRAEEELGRLDAKLGHAEFRERAPAEVVAREEARRAEQAALSAKLREALERLDALDERRG
jgi:valyl-tRNA synthetase